MYGETLAIFIPKELNEKIVTLARDPTVLNYLMFFLNYLKLLFYVYYYASN